MRSTSSVLLAILALWTVAFGVSSRTTEAARSHEGQPGLGDAFRAGFVGGSFSAIFAGLAAQVRARGRGRGSAAEELPVAWGCAAISFLQALEFSPDLRKLEFSCRHAGSGERRPDAALPLARCRGVRPPGTLRALRRGARRWRGYRRLGGKRGGVLVKSSMMGLKLN